MADFQAKSQKSPDKKKPVQSVPDTGLDSYSGLSVEQLQRTIGNQATMNLLQRSPSPQSIVRKTIHSDAVQLTRKKRGKKKKRKGGGGNRNSPPQTVETQSPAQTWSDWFWSWAPEYKAPEGDEEELEIEDDPNFEREGGGSIVEVEGSQAWSTNRETGETGESEYPEEETKPFENPFAIEKLELDLGEIDFSAEDTSVGTVKAKGKSSISGTGKQTYSGKVTAEGSMGKGEAQGKAELTQDSIAGEGKASFLLGASDETKFGTLGWQSEAGSGLVGSGKMETKVGISSDLAAKIAYNLEKMEGEASGKLGAFFGVATENTVDIKIKANGKDLATTEGKIGISYGVGGEISGFIKWDSGTLSFGNQGKLSAGLGFSYGYSVKIDTNAIASATASGARSGLSWLWSWAWGS